MVGQIRVSVESLNDAGDVVDKEIVMTKSVVKPNHIIELGLRHSEQIDLLRQIEQQLLSEHSTGQAPWYPSRPKGRVQAALAPHLLAPEVRCTA